MTRAPAAVRELVASLRLVGALVHRNHVSLRRAMRVEREIATTAAWRRARGAAADLRRSHRSDNPADALKYLDVDRWLRTALRRAARLQLFDRPPLRIVDLGIGAGVFAHVCRHFGHEVSGVDLPLDDMPETSRIVYQRMIEVFDVPVARAHIVSSAAPPLPPAVDLVTAYMITFNAHRTDAEWGLGEWQAFVGAVLPKLRAGGRLHLELNPHPERYGTRGFYDAETEAFFASAGRLSRPGIVTILADR